MKLTRLNPNGLEFTLISDAKRTIIMKGTDSFSVDLTLNEMSSAWDDWIEKDLPMKLVFPFLSYEQRLFLLEK